MELSYKTMRKHQRQEAWLPIDSRLFPHIFSFGHVKGVALIFLTVEMFLAVLTVIGTLFLVILSQLK